MYRVGPADKLERHIYSVLYDECIYAGLVSQTHQIFVCISRFCSYRDIGRKRVDFM